MGILINDSSRESVKKYYKLLHVTAVITAVIGSSIWFATPFFTREIKFNRWHQTFRWFSIVVGLGSGGYSLMASMELSKLEPRMQAVEKFELAQEKNAIAAELHLTMQTNSAIAQAITRERREELGLLPMPEEGYKESYNSYDNDNGVSYNGSNDDNGVTNKVTDQEREQVAIALADGVPESEIIKTTLKAGGARYPEGRAKLDKIKSELEKEEEE